MTNFFDQLPEPAKQSKLQFLKHAYRGFRPIVNKKFTVESYPDLTNKICIITGMNTGIGYEVVDILLSKNCTVYGIVRTESKGKAAKETLLAKNKDTKGSLSIIAGCDLSDFNSVKQTGLKIQELLKGKEVDFVIHNAGLMSNFNDRSNADGIELMFATNVMGPQLLQAYIDPLFLTKKKSENDLKRIIWLSSLAHMAGPSPYGFNQKDPKYLDLKSRPHSSTLYGQSKASSILQAKAYGIRHQTDEKYGIQSVSVFPGILTTELARDYPGFVQKFWNLAFYAPKFGAYSELYGCFYPDLKTGDYVIPFGAVDTPRQDINSALENGVCLKFWDYVQEEIKDYLPKN